MRWPPTASHTTCFTQALFPYGFFRAWGAISSVCISRVCVFLGGHVPNLWCLVSQSCEIQTCMHMAFAGHVKLFPWVAPVRVVSQCHSHSMLTQLLSCWWHSGPCKRIFHLYIAGVWVDVHGACALHRSCDLALSAGFIGWECPLLLGWTHIYHLSHKWTSQMEPVHVLVVFS